MNLHLNLILYETMMHLKIFHSKMLLHSKKNAKVEGLIKKHNLDLKMQTLNYLLIKMNFMIMKEFKIIINLVLTFLIDSHYSFHFHFFIYCFCSNLDFIIMMAKIMNFCFQEKKNLQYFRFHYLFHQFGEEEMILVGKVYKQ